MHLLLQVCDSDLTILNILPKYPGSCNDKFIFKGSAVKRRMEAAYNDDPCWLLGRNNEVCGQVVACDADIIHMYIICR